MEEAIEAKNSILINLKYSLAHSTKAYKDAIRVYGAKLVKFGIPAEELGLEPLVTNTSTMPAGLVAAWRPQYESKQKTNYKNRYYFITSYSFKESKRNDLYEKFKLNYFFKSSLYLHSRARISISQPFWLHFPLTN